MMGLVEYFVHNYGLVIGNDQSTYHAATGAAQRVVRGSGITRAEWLALSAEDRANRYAAEVGAAIGDLIQMWCEEALIDRDHPGALIFREVALHNDSDVQRGLGEHFMPEDAEIADLLE